MKICKNLSEVTKVVKCEEWETQKTFERFFLKSGSMPLSGMTVFFESNDKDLEYVVVDLNNDKDCRDYFFKYEVDNFEWVVKTDDIVGVEKCKVIGVQNNKWDIYRATVVTETGTQLNRFVKYVIDKEDEEYEEDGCIYFWDKE